MSTVLFKINEIQEKLLTIDSARILTDDRSVDRFSSLDKRLSTLEMNTTTQTNCANPIDPSNAVANPVTTEESKSTEPATMATTVKTTNSAIQPEPDGRWTTIVREGGKRKEIPINSNNGGKSVSAYQPRIRKEPLVGKATKTGITAVRRKRLANVFATRFNPNLEPDELKKYLEEKLSSLGSISVERLKSKFAEHYSSFYIKAECDDPSVFMDPEIWPAGIYFRWYRPNRSLRKNDNTLRSAEADI